jgi:hypothetical protein
VCIPVSQAEYQSEQGSHSGFYIRVGLKSGTIFGKFKSIALTTSLADVVPIVCRPLFVAGSENGSLAPFLDGEVPNSLVAEVGGRVQRFREFVVFKGDQIFIECVQALPVRRAAVAFLAKQYLKIHICYKSKL